MEKAMSWFVVDVEADGPIPAAFSMVSFGVVRVDAYLATTFFAQVAPVSERWVPEALAVSRVTREEHLTFPSPKVTMQDFNAWLLMHNIGSRPVFVSDNPASDWQWINWYCHTYLGENPFGFSGRRIGDLYAGLQRDCRAANNWKKLRRTAHTHHPVDDAKGNAEALLAMVEMGLKPGW